MNAQITRHFYSEFLGTFALVFIGSGAIITAAKNAGGLVEVALAHGLVLGVMVSVFKRIAAHFNPAVTIAFFAMKRLPVNLTIVHLVAQFAGAILAAFALKAVLPSGWYALAAGGTPAVDVSVTGTQAWILEALATFFLMTSIYGTCVDKRAPDVGGFGVGLTLAFAIFVLGPITGASLNPARSFGPAMAYGVFEAQAIYFTAPVIGAILAALAYEKLILRDDPAQT
jgi:MIP family channel proteins